MNPESRREFLIPIWDDFSPIAILRVTAPELAGVTAKASFDSDDACDENGFRRSRVQVKCPTCKAGVQPFMAPLTTRWITSGSGWANLDTRIWWTNYLCACRRGHKFVLHTYTTG